MGTGRKGCRHDTGHGALRLLLLGEDGQSVGFQAHELASDDLALQTAGALMQDLPEVHQIRVWSGVRPVLTLTRPDGPPLATSL
ncbi:hypothetical protein [Phenylobacterium sp. J367]|uniref:hypothetical protein n=1 Tax=Phenylobacterium sp. J367 TaxID=2898435 RepID=UPI0021510F05|nr:hypothetical protein [Phenylobacterium sp. J367]MCR5877847.1 hypothetical protein [Phenylobacterium sp. J367]